MYEFSAFLRSNQFLGTGSQSARHMNGVDARYARPATLVDS